MPPRTYLIDRFRADAAALRQRVVLLQSGAPPLGPDALTSLRMAEACDDVIAIVEAIPESDETTAVVSTLTAIIPLLERRAAAASDAPAVRAVYAGAATRIREIAAAESGHSLGGADGHVVDLDDLEGRDA